MGKEEVYSYIKEKTLGQTIEGKQIKVSASQIIQDLKENEQTIFRILRNLLAEQNSDLHMEKSKKQRTKPGKKVIYYERCRWR